ncbi:MAG: DNA-formamidopyrimidine glycosylase family protein [Acidobacteriota bacterium]
MAEGHAVARWAVALRALVRERLEAVDATTRWKERAAELPGERVTGVDTHGNHLMIRVSGGWTIHCHAMQYGSWQVGPPGQELRKERRYIRLRLLTKRHEAVYYHGPVMEILTDAEAAEHPKLDALGPDLLAEPFDRKEARRRLAEASGREIGDAILDQRIVSGIGNIFKSEGLFLAGIDPRRDAATVGEAELDRLWDGLVPIMREGVGRYGPTITLPEELRGDGGEGGRGDRNWVYRRRGRPCLRCGETVERIRQGDLGRATFYCPRCQASRPLRSSTTSSRT